MSQKTMGIILMSTMIAIGIATITNCINIALAQFSKSIPFLPSTGQSPSSLSPPSSPSSPSLSPLPPTEQPSNVNPAPAGNITASAINSTNIAPRHPPLRPIIVGPSSLTASPITSESQGNVNATSIPSNNGSFFLGRPR
jgi:hypothetical protein